MRSSVALFVALAAPLLVAGAFNREDWTVPPNFVVEPYLWPSIPKARSLALSGNSKRDGPVITYVSAQSFGADKQNITAMVDLNGKGSADYAQVILIGLSSMPNGIAWRNNKLYIASLEPYSTCKLWRLDNVDSYALNQQVAQKSDLVLLRDDLPFDFWHGWKFIRFGPDGRLYVPIGANCNICKLDGSPANNGYLPNGTTIYNYANSGDPYHVTAPFQKNSSCPAFEFGSIYSFAADGSDPQLHARGVRNTVGFDWHPNNNRLYFTDNGRDNMGGSDMTYTENHPDCELNYASSSGQHFGFPYCHTGPTGDNADARPYLRLPGIGSNYADPNLNVNSAVWKCNGAGLNFTPAIQAMGPHTAPLGMRFYKWSSVSNFPKEYNNSMFVALHGSWNRNRPIGAKVMRVTLDPANPGKVATHTSFLAGGVPGDTGNMDGPQPNNQSSGAYKGRPVDVEQLPDGSLLVSDDYAGSVYRISYRPPLTCRTTSSGGGEIKDTPLAISGASNGCVVNIGSYGQPAYRRCVQWNLNQAGNYLQLAYNIYKIAGTSQAVLDGALVLPRHMCTNRGGWMAVGLPKDQSQDNMYGAKMILARPAPGTLKGAVVQDYKMVNITADTWIPTTGFLNGDVNAYVSADALVAKFQFKLPASFGGTSPPSILKIIAAVGEIDSNSNLKRHWAAHSTKLTYNKADLGVVPNATATPLPILNRGLGPKPANMAPPPGPPPNPEPEPPTPACATPDAPCCLSGVQYDACLNNAASGVSLTQYYRASKNRLYVALRAATTTNWISWAYNPGWPGHMVGADSFFARPCTTCPTGVSTIAFNLYSTSLGSFKAPQVVTFNPEGSPASGTLASGADIWAAFSIPLVTSTQYGSGIRINYGSGRYTGTDPASGSGMLAHTTTPPSICIQSVNGTASITGATGCPAP